jgi:inorganic triphosphatase YgiF
VATETELKLAVRPVDLPVLWRALRAMAAAGTARRSNLVSTYYETEDRTLARRGLVLRVREQDGRFIQTVKSLSTDGASLARDEWEDVIAAGRPDPLAPETGRFLTGQIAERVEPLFRTIVQRDRVELSPAPGTRIEAAIDRGEIRSCGAKRARRIGEIELELKSGDVAALYDVALQLLDKSPVRIELARKSARGYELANGAATVPEAVRSAPVDLDASLTAEEALRRIGSACLGQLMRNESAVREGDPEAVHQMRVAIRRLRTVLSAFRMLLPKAQRRWAVEELRWLSSGLGEARNLDVFGTALIAPAKPELAGKVDLRALEGEVARRRRAAYSGLREALGSKRYTGLILRLMRWFEGRGWRHAGNCEDLRRPIGEVAPKMLHRRRRAVERRRKGFAGQSAEAQHELRLAVKKLRYTADLFAGLYATTPAGQFATRLKRLQDDLGAANDVHVGGTLVAELARGAKKRGDEIAAAGKKVLAWHERRLRTHRKKVGTQLKRLGDDKPFWRE